MNNKVLERAQTYFSKGWNLYGRPDQITPFSLAEAGFICIGGDSVQCHECGGILGSWTKEDVPMREHRRHFPTCPFVKNWDKKIIQSHENVKLAMSAGYSFDLIHDVIQKDRSILEKPTAVLFEACKREDQRNKAENEAERKRMLQEGDAVDEDWKALLLRYHR